jgi:hypothetical protein
LDQYYDQTLHKYSKGKRKSKDTLRDEEDYYTVGVKKNNYIRTTSHLVAEKYNAGGSRFLEVLADERSNIDHAFFSPGLLKRVGVRD